MLKLGKLLKSNKNDGPDSFICVDIGSDVVKVFAFEVEVAETGPKATVIGIGKALLPNTATRGGVIIEENEVVSTLRTALDEAYNQAGYQINDVIFGVSGELSLGLMTTVKLNKETSKKISQDDLDIIQNKIFEAAQDEIMSQVYKTTGNSDVDLDLITSSVVYSKSDDQQVDTLLGLTPKNLEIAMFTAFTPNFHTQILQNLANKLKLNILAIGSQMYSITKLLTFTKGKNFDAVIMDVGGDITDIGIVFGGGIVSTKSMPIGGSSFTKAIKQDLDISYVEAEKKKYGYSYNKLSEQESSKIRSSLHNVLETWLTGIEILYTEFDGVKTFASDIYLVGGGAELLDLTDYLANEPWTRSIAFKSPPDFKKLSLKDLRFINDGTGRMHSLADIMPASLCLVYLEMQGLLDE